MSSAQIPYQHPRPERQEGQIFRRTWLVPITNTDLPKPKLSLSCQEPNLHQRHDPRTFICLLMTSKYPNQQVTSWEQNSSNDSHVTSILCHLVSRCFLFFCVKMNGMTNKPMKTYQVSNTVEEVVRNWECQNNLCTIDDNRWQVKISNHLQVRGEVSR